MMCCQGGDWRRLEALERPALPRAIPPASSGADVVQPAGLMQVSGPLARTYRLALPAAPFSGSERTTRLSLQKGRRTRTHSVFAAMHFCGRAETSPPHGPAPPQVWVRTLRCGHCLSPVLRTPASARRSGRVQSQEAPTSTDTHLPRTPGGPGPRSGRQCSCAGNVPSTPWLACLGAVRSGATRTRCTSQEGKRYSCIYWFYDYRRSISKNVEKGIRSLQGSPPVHSLSRNKLTPFYNQTEVQAIFSFMVLSRSCRRTADGVRPARPHTWGPGHRVHRLVEE